MIRSRAIPAVATLLAVLAIGATVLLLRESDRNHAGELKLQSVKLALSELQTAFISKKNGNPVASAAVADRHFAEGKREIDRMLAELREDSPSAELSAVDEPLQENYAALQSFFAQVFAQAVGGEAPGRESAPGGSPPAGAFGLPSPQPSKARADRVLNAAGEKYGARADTETTRATIGAAASVLLLLMAFVFYYARSTRAASENRRILSATREDSLTDALTGLSNRRSLINDLEVEVEAAEGDSHSLLLAFFDLDRFKEYNDTYGHPAGDALLTRLGARLDAAVGEGATAYRMGGDEFCVLARTAAGTPSDLIATSLAALSEDGERFEVSCSVGTALVPDEADDAKQALLLADKRLYQQKGNPNRSGLVRT